MKKITIHNRKGETVTDKQVQFCLYALREVMNVSPEIIETPLALRYSVDIMLDEAGCRSTTMKFRLGGDNHFACSSGLTFEQFDADYYVDIRYSFTPIEEAA